MLPVTGRQQNACQGTTERIRITAEDKQPHLVRHNGIRWYAGIPRNGGVEDWKCRNPAIRLVFSFREQMRCDLWRTQALVPLLGCLPAVHLSEVNRALTLMLRQVVLLLQHLRRSMLNLKGGVVRQPGKKTRRGG